MIIWLFIHKLKLKAQGWNNLERHHNSLFSWVMSTHYNIRQVYVKGLRMSIIIEDSDNVDLSTYSNISKVKMILRFFYF